MASEKNQRWYKQQIQANLAATAITKSDKQLMDFCQEQLLGLFDGNRNGSSTVGLKVGLPTPFKMFRACYLDN